MKPTNALSLTLLLVSCARPTQPSTVELAPVLPTPAQSTWDSVVAAVLHRVVVHGLPDFSALRTVVIQNDSGFVSSSSLPRIDSVGFVLLGSAQVQELANRLGRVNVLMVGRPWIGEDTARSGASNRWIRRPDGHSRVVSMSVCAYRLRRLEGAWQVDSTLGCLIT